VVWPRSGSGTAAPSGSPESEEQHGLRVFPPILNGRIVLQLKFVQCICVRS
jgi:hypothetical protein